MLDDHRPLIRSLKRRGLIRGSLSLGTLIMLTGCDVNRPESVEAGLLAISRLNDRVQALLFDPNKLAPTYPASTILQPPQSPSGKFMLGCRAFAASGGLTRAGEMPKQCG
jgi:hypothetical protein